MKKFALFALAAAFCLPAMAQPSGRTTAQPSTTKASKVTSVTGCVSESDGKYMVTNKANPNGVQLMTSEDLKARVGQKMKMSGTLSDDKTSMNVTSMKPVSPTCTVKAAKTKNQ